MIKKVKGKTLEVPHIDRQKVINDWKVSGCELKVNRGMIEGGTSGMIGRSKFVSFWPFLLGSVFGYRFRVNLPAFDIFWSKYWIFDVFVIESTFHSKRHSQ